MFTKKGQSAVEVSLVLALIAVVALALMADVGKQVKCAIFIAGVGAGGGSRFSSANGTIRGDDGFAPGWDLNSDGAVNGGDLFLFRQYYTQCPWLLKFI